MKPYRISLPAIPRIPILLSVPHCGTDFPDDIRDEYVPDLIASPDDTDWFVDRLYGFASSLGITMISGVFSRWVIDLNRHPQSRPLYTDGRIITDLCPVSTFLNEPLYKDKRKNVPAQEVYRRTELYFNPYHAMLREILESLKSDFGRALLWDCHSIRQIVPTIQREKFPDLILGSADGHAAHPGLINTALDNLGADQYTLQHNDPFKGGYITRQYGSPSDDIHALQLEMTKVNYMNDEEKRYHPGRAERMAQLLRSTLHALARTLNSLKDL